MAEVLYPGQHKGRVIVRESGIRRPLDPRFDLGVHFPSGFGRGKKTMARRSFRSRCSPMLFDLPLNFHPATIRASAVDTPFGAV